MPEEQAKKKEKTVVQRVLFGAFNAFAAILASLLLMRQAPGGDRSWMVLPLVIGASAGALGGFLYHRIVGVAPKQLHRVIGIAVYLTLVLAAFALAMTGLA